MTTTYLQLTNSVLHRLNEPELTSTTFSSSKGIHVQVKDAVNDAIRDIATQKWEWPFLHTSGSQLLTVGTQIYSLPAATKTVDWGSFYIQRSTVLSVEALPLQALSYDHWMQNYRLSDFSADETSEYDVPRYVFRTQALEFGVTPKPKSAYTVKFEYWAYPTALSAHGDTSQVPDHFNPVIVERAMHHTYRFNGKTEEASRSLKISEDGIKNMARLLIRAPDYMNDSRSGPHTNPGPK